MINRAKTIKVEDVEKILFHLGEQDKLIFRVSVETGLRISDILKIRSADVSRYIHVIEQKTKKLRTVELSDGLVNDLCVYRGSWYDVKLTDWLFPSRISPDKHLHRSTYHHRRLKEACKRSGVDCSAHSARKLYAQELLKSTGDIFAVQKELNHKFLFDTCGYLDIDYVKLMKSVVELSRLSFGENEKK